MRRGGGGDLYGVEVKIAKKKSFSKSKIFFVPKKKNCMACMAYKSK